MEKIPVLFKRQHGKMYYELTKEIAEGNEWVFGPECIASRKYDGTACAILTDGNLYKRYDVKNGKKAPDGAIPCQEPDVITGHHPHWVLCDRNNPNDKYHFRAFDLLDKKEVGTYELIGEKIQGNPEGIEGYKLVRHGVDKLELKEISWDYLHDYLLTHNIEGIVFFNNLTGKRCKIRQKDFGFKR